MSKLVSPSRTEFTVNTRTTVFNGEMFTIGSKLTFVVDNALLASGHIWSTLVNLAPGDEVTIKVEKTEGKWQIKELSSRADKGRSFESFLADLEQERQKS